MEWTASVSLGVTAKNKYDNNNWRHVISCHTIACAAYEIPYGAVRLIFNSRHCYHSRRQDNQE